MIKITASRNVIECLRVYKDVAGNPMKAKTELRSSRVTMHTKAGQFAVYGRFLASTLHLAAAAASRIGSRADLSERNSEAIELLRRAWAEQSELRTHEESDEDWCGVFCSGVLIYTENCPSEIVFIESVANGAEFSAALLRDVEAQYARLGRNTGFRMVTERAVDLQTVEGRIECNIVTRGPEGRKPIHFTFEHRRVEDNVLCALRTAADVIDASVILGKQMRMKSSSQEGELDQRTSESLDIMRTRLNLSKSRVKKMAESKGIRFQPALPNFGAPA